MVPVAWALHLSHQQPVISFVFAFLAIIPLASLLSFATEQLALRMGDALGGLLNATFGNAVELLISILALVKGEIGLVQASMIGSILSNTLLVLGFCFFCGGLRFHEQIYSTSASQLQISLLGIAVSSAARLPETFSGGIELTALLLWSTRHDIDVRTCPPRRIPILLVVLVDVDRHSTYRGDYRSRQSKSIHVAQYLEGNEFHVVVDVCGVLDLSAIQ